MTDPEGTSAEGQSEGTEAEEAQTKETPQSEATQTEQDYDRFGIVNPDGTLKDGWWKKLDDPQLRKSKNLEKFTRLHGIAKSYDDLSRKIGKNPDNLVELPSDDASDEAKANFWKQLGVPEDPSQYEFKKSEDLPEDLEIDEQVAGKLKEWAQRNKIPQANFNQAVNEAIQLKVEMDQQQAEQIRQQIDDNREEAEKELRKEWGNDYDRRVNRANQVLKQFAGEEAVDELGLENSPEMVRFLDSIAENMSEDKLVAAKSSAELTPAQADAKLAELRSHPGYRDPNHPEHKRLMERKTQLFKIKNSA